MELISVIIVNFNAGWRLSNCVEAIMSSTVPVQIIVVDNASQDGSVEKLKCNYSHLKNLQIILNQVNLGFAAACNQGTNSADGDFILYLNPDCVIESTTILAMVEALKSDSKAGMAGAMLINPDGSEQAGGRRAVPTPWRSIVRLSGLYRLRKRFPKLFYDFYPDNDYLPEVPIAVEATSGACMMVTREALNDVGSFDEEYFLHVEDLDWCMRFRQKGYKILFVPSARAIHYKGSCSEGKTVFVEWHKHRGMIRFYRKFFSDCYSGIQMVLLAGCVWGHFLLVATNQVAKKIRFIK